MEKAQQKGIISINLGGISNRVKCLISVWRLSEKYNRKLILYWPLNHTCGAKFSDLFENKINQIGEEELNRINKKDIQIFGSDLVAIRDCQKKYMISGTFRLLLTPNELSKYPGLIKEGIDLKFSDIPEEVKRNIIEYLKKLEPLKSIKKELNSFQKKYNLKSMVGVHIRRGDFADRPTSPGKVSSDEKFIERMNELIKEKPETRFFLCTDSKEMEEKLETIFPGKIIKFTKTSLKRTDVRATQEGLIDLLLLSKTKQILGTYRSTFTEMAWWFGECKAKLEIIKDIEIEKEFFKNVQKEERKIIPKIKRIILILLGRKFI
jgi:hypothetical protein